MEVKCSGLQKKWSLNVNKGRHGEWVYRNLENTKYKKVS